MDNSITAFLTALHSAMSDKEKFRLDITRNGDSLDLIVLPMLSDDDSKVPDAAKPVRAALSMPLAMRNMSLDEVGTEFGQRLSGFGEARKEATDAYSELLMSLKDATAAAKNSSTKTTEKGKKDKDSKPSKVQVKTPDSTPQSTTTEEPKESPVQATSNDSQDLFNFS